MTIWNEVSKLKVYISGPIRLRIDPIVDRSKLSLVARRVALCGHFPIVPGLMYESFFLDPRYANKTKWYKNFCSEFLKMCDLMCFVVEPLGYQSEITRFEQENFDGLKIPEHAIVDYLTYRRHKN